MQQQNPGAASILCQHSVEKQQQEGSDPQVLVPALCSPQGCLGGNDGEVSDPTGAREGTEHKAQNPKPSCLSRLTVTHPCCNPASPEHTKSWCKTSESWDVPKKNITAYGRLLLFGTARLGKCRSCIFKPFPFLLLKWGLELCCYFCKRDSQKIL